ncbi:uncharacterized protein LOC122800890 [Protopterus annectens]|uniref:uncharacterized protein LOC122800890 n=1 Tax=Protopterus annectens TaxID=7888 RepID=UPI001CFA72A5|nr:uncharacterized protein LOC122800890 [Protopterus annectens]
MIFFLHMLIVATVWEDTDSYQRRHLDGPYECHDPIPLFSVGDVANLTGDCDFYWKPGRDLFAVTTKPALTWNLTSTEYITTVCRLNCDRHTEKCTPNPAGGLYQRLNESGFSLAESPLDSSCIAEFQRENDTAETRSPSLEIYAMDNSSTVFDGLGHIIRYTRGCKTVSSARIIQHIKIIINMTAVDITTRHSQCKSTNLWLINSLHLKNKYYQYRRNKRDVTGIMGTALGAVGSGTGFLNSIDVDTLRSKLSRLGEDLNMAFKLLADHDPELGQRTVDSVITQTVMWRWIDHANMYTEQVLNNLTKELNQSFCILSQLAANQQYLQFIQVWGAKRPSHWQNELQLYNWLKPLDFTCENDSCMLTFDYLASKKGTKQVCPFVALPLQFGNNWWMPQIESNLIDYNDVPIDLAGCETWPQGWVCMLIKRKPHPCLHNGTGECIWHRYIVNGTDD